MQIDKKLLFKIGAAIAAGALALALYAAFPAPLTPEEGTRFLNEAAAQGSFELKGRRNIARHFIALPREEVVALLAAERAKNPDILLFPQLDLRDTNYFVFWNDRSTIDNPEGRTLTDDTLSFMMRGSSKKLGILGNLNARVTSFFAGENLFINEYGVDESSSHLFRSIDGSGFKAKAVMGDIDTDQIVWGTMGEPIAQFISNSGRFEKWNLLFELFQKDRKIKVHSIANLLTKDGKIVMVESESR